MRIRFVSGNPLKIREVREMLAPAGVEIIPASYRIMELQTEDVEKLVRDKLLKAFTLIGRPVLVEHSGLYLRQLNDLPGGLTEIFWEKLHADTFSRLFGNMENTSALAVTVVGFCDGCKIHLFRGEVEGNIAPSPRGACGFHWDCIFIPKGEKETFAEMGDRKSSISMRKIAFDHFLRFLERRRD